MGTGPEADLTSLRTKLLSSEKVLAVLPLREGLALPGSPGPVIICLPQASTSTQGSRKGKCVRRPGEFQGGTLGRTAFLGLKSTVDGCFMSCSFGFNSTFKGR